MDDGEIRRRRPQVKSGKRTNNTSSSSSEFKLHHGNTSSSLATVITRRRPQVKSDKRTNNTSSSSSESKLHHGNTSSSLATVFAVATGIIFGFAAVGYLRSPLEPVNIELEPKPEFEGNLKVNDVLERGERLLNGLAGPESIDVDEKGNIYTGLLDGRIIKVHPSATGAIGEGLVEDVHTGPIKGVDPIDGHINPRPLGLRLHEDVLYIADAYYGLYSLNVKTKKIRALVKPNDVEPSMKFPNDLDVTLDGKYIYFTDTSYRWNLKELYSDFVEGSCTGRLFRYTVKTGSIKTLASNLCFANGVQLSDDERTIAVTESMRFRVLFLDARTGKVEHVTVLPGLPDNIRRSKNGGYWVAIPIGRTFLVDFLAGRPWLRKILSGLLPMKFAPYFSKTDAGVAVELDKNGEIISSIHDQYGKTSRTVSEICETDDGILLAGSYKEPYMVKIKR